jgi:transposase-like protein
MRCPQCKSSRLVKAGFTLDNKQRYQCQKCKLHFKQGDKRGNARKKSSQKVGRPISFRCSEEQMASLEKAAKELNLSVTDYIRYKLNKLFKTT